MRVDADSRGAGAQARQGQVLGRVPAPVSVAVRSAAMVAVAALLAVGVLVTRPAVPGISAGATEPEPLRVYRIRTGLAPEPVKDEVRAVDELAFAYHNTTGKKWLLIYGVDEHGHVYWFHPSGSETAAVPALEGEGLHALPPAISHTLDGRRLTLHGVLADERLTVQRAESLMQGREPGAPLPLPGAITTSRSVKVRE